MIGAYVRWIVARHVDGSVAKQSSWHFVVGYTPNGSYRTRCGRLVRLAFASWSDALPGDQKSCEACLRYAAGDATSVDTDEVTQ